MNYAQFLSIGNPGRHREVARGSLSRLTAGPSTSRRRPVQQDASQDVGPNALWYHDTNHGE
ncbi:hypothetical protein CPB86DRAFT_784779 [Serendipita vermifera]|nr:hypothetical protein CPB86DRAFT_784779 [Serendipita vermifera]